MSFSIPPTQMDATRCRWDTPMLRKIDVLIIATARCITIPARTLSGRIISLSPASRARRPIALILSFRIL